jgi:hypothetical protein
MRPRIAFIFTILLFWLIIVSPTIATPTNEITVCSTGCDYAVIQPAIDAATSGDTIVVATSVYTGQLNLRSNITLTAQDGPANTIITALSSPIISGSDIYSVTVQGFSIQGSPVVSISNGIVLTNSSVMISNVIIGNLYGANGTTIYSNGLTAIGLQLSGSISVTLSNSIIENVAGGNADVDSSGQGGDGIGVAAFGDGQLLVLSSTIHSVVGGAAGLAWAGISWCDGVSGSSIGILKEGTGYLGVEHSKIEGLLGGTPCHPNESPYPCPNNAGDATAIQAISGTLDMQNNRLINNAIWSSESNASVTGLSASNMTFVNVENNEITSRFIGLTYAGSIQTTISAPESPTCGISGGNSNGVVLNTTGAATLKRNFIHDLRGWGLNGQASGIYARGVDQLTASNNQIDRLFGGSKWYPQFLDPATSGIAIEDIGQATIDANRISHLYGGESDYCCYGNVDSDGGDVAGLQILSTTQVNVVNNLLYSFTGGNGDLSYTNGGNATGFNIYSATTNIQNNTIYAMRGGAAGFSNAINGQGIGLQLNAGSNILATNNAIISNTIGVSATTKNYLWDYNALWHNTLAYSGIVTGAHDVHLDPLFIDPQNGDFHLPFDSPLIDAGFNILAPDHDFDGTPRPIDGNHDNLSLTDIGAYEYEPVTLFVYYLPLILK